MQTIPEIIYYLKYGRKVLFDAIEGLSQRELTEKEVYEGWTVKDILAHIIGWDEQVINNLTLVRQGQIADVTNPETEVHNPAAVARWRDKSWREVLGAVQQSYQQIIDSIAATDYSEIDRRHERQGRIFTIRSYIIETMVEHIRRHAAEIELWRQSLEEDIDAQAIVLQMKQHRADFMRWLDSFTDDAELVEPNAVGRWSINDLVGHVVDWEARMLQSARHIYDPSLPEVAAVDASTTDWNELMVAQRTKKTFAENHHDLRESQIVVDSFLADLTPGDWKLRGPFPWPDDQGTLAELVINVGEHYHTHALDLQKWHASKHR